MTPNFFPGQDVWGFFISDRGRPRPQIFIDGVFLFIEVVADYFTFFSGLS